MFVWADGEVISVHQGEVFLNLSQDGGRSGMPIRRSKEVPARAEVCRLAQDPVGIQPGGELPVLVLGPPGHRGPRVDRVEEGRGGVRLQERVLQVDN